MTTPANHTAAVQAMLVQHLPALRGFVLSLVSDFHLVDDVVQETFLVVTEKAAQFQMGTNFRAWAWTIERFKALQAVEKARLSHHLSTEVLEALCSEKAAEHWHTEQQLQHLAVCMDELAPKARQTVELRYQHAQRPPEIAQRLGWTVEAVHVALSRARVALRECVTRRMARA